MSQHYDQTIADLQQVLKKQEGEVIKTKDMINRLCEFAGREPMYQESDLKSSDTLTAIQSDTFYGKALSTAVREVLEMRKAANMGPAKVKEIYDTLVKGGYLFDAKNDANAQRGLRISLTKNSASFHKLPDGTFGLVSWYPKIANSRHRTNDEGRDDGSDSDDAAESELDAEDEA
jgi:hypothetical protein